MKTVGQQPADTGLVTKTGLLPEIAGPAFAAADGAVVGPVKTVLGWQLAKLVKIEPGKPAVLAEVHDEIAKQLANRQASDQLVEVANQLDDALAGGASLEEAAKKLGLPLQTVADVARNGEGLDGKPIADLVGTPQLLPVAFSTDPGQTSSQIDDGANGYFILRVDQVTPPALRPLDQVKAKVLADWQAEARDKAAADKAQADHGPREGGRGSEDRRPILRPLGQAQPALHPRPGRPARRCAALAGFPAVRR